MSGDCQYRDYYYRISVNAARQSSWSAPRDPSPSRRPSEPAKKSGPNIPKNRCRTTIAERMVETRAKQPFIGDQVGLLKPRPPAACPSKTSDGSAFRQTQFAVLR
jgi:hypothetical protein